MRFFCNSNKLFSIGQDRKEGTFHGLIAILLRLFSAATGKKKTWPITATIHGVQVENRTGSLCNISLKCYNKGLGYLYEYAWISLAVKFPQFGTQPTLQHSSHFETDSHKKQTIIVVLDFKLSPCDEYWYFGIPIRCTFMPWTHDQWRWDPQWFPKRQLF